MHGTSQRKLPIGILLCLALHRTTIGVARTDAPHALCGRTDDGIRVGDDACCGSTDRIGDSRSVNDLEQFDFARDCPAPLCLGLQQFSKVQKRWYVEAATSRDVNLLHPWPKLLHSLRFFFHIDYGGRPPPSVYNLSPPHPGGHESLRSRAQ